MIVNEQPMVTRKGVPRLSDAVDRMKVTDEPHEMKDPFDIGEMLTQLAEQGEPITIYQGGRAREPIMARIDSVDPEEPYFVLDIAGGAQLEVGVPALLVASLGNNAKMQFELPDDWHLVRGHTHMVNCTFPEGIQVLNRRAQSRVESPVGGNYTATFILLSQKRSLQLYDFSPGGIGMRGTPQQAIGLRVGKKLEGVRLDIGDDTITVDVEIRLARRFRTFLLGEQVQIGCKFINMTPQKQEQLKWIIAQHVGPKKPGERAREGAQHA